MAKKFVLTVTEDVDSECFNVKAENSGFNGFELLGILTAKMHDIFMQHEEPTKFVRKLIYPDGTVEILDKEDEEE